MDVEDQEIARNNQGMDTHIHITFLIFLLAVINPVRASFRKRS